MINIFIEAGCNRYVRDECRFCHVYEPLMQIPKSDWHLPLDQARLMVDKIKEVDIFRQLAEREINLTGGEPSQNPEVVEIFKLCKTLTPNVRLHSNLDINSKKDKRWLRLVDIMKLGGRVDFTLYPTVWESKQKPLLEEILAMQDELIVNIIFEKVADLIAQLDTMIEFFKDKGERLQPAILLMQAHRDRVQTLLEKNPECDQETFSENLQDVDSYVCSNNFTFALNLILGFVVDEDGKREMVSMPFSKDINVLECTIPRGTIEIITVEQTGQITPCCDVGNLKCQPKFGNLLNDTPDEIMNQIEISRKKMISGAMKNRSNIEQGKAGEWVEEGIPPYCV